MNWLPQAEPQTLTQLHNKPRCPEVVNEAANLGITSIVHFTRVQPGLVGVLHARAIKARQALPKEHQLRHVYEPNAADRSRDVRWHQYINLSITNINPWMFNYSSGWHKDAQWVILSFNPNILSEPGVVFCTTNNAYPSVRRQTGLGGFNQMFYPEVPGYQERISTRDEREPNQTTDPQAEILYPSAVSLDHLQSIIVQDDDTYEAVTASLSIFELDRIRITTDPEAFE